MSTPTIPPDEHNATILDQFTRQASTFGQILAHSDAIDLLRYSCDVTPNDIVLDVACGPGLLVLDFARHAAWVTGLDLTPRMLEEAKRAAQVANISNVNWTLGDAYSLPFDDNSFSVVMSRFAFHHYQDPEVAFAEMVRVTRPEGRVLVADVCMDDSNSATFDRLECLRDNSHVHALTAKEHTRLWEGHGLSDLKKFAYAVQIPLQAQLKASFFSRADGRDWEREVTVDVGQNRTGYAPRQSAHGVMLHYPIGVMVGRKLMPPVQ